MTETNKTMSGRPQSADRESGYGSDKDAVPLLTRSLARLGLDDDGTRNWHKESTNYLDGNYEGWKEQQETVMVPPSLHPHPLNVTTGEETEKLIFDLLKEFGEKYQEPMFIVHSYGFCELVHKLVNGNESTKWVKGEHDFVIIHRVYGILFLEVKSNEMTRVVYKKAKEQLTKAKEATMFYFKKKFGKSKLVINAVYNYPGFVVMPKCQKQIQSHVYDDVVYKEDCSSPESFKEWWDEKIASPFKDLNRTIDQKVYEEFVIRFVPFSCLLPTLNLQIDQTHHNIVKVFTPKQLEAWHHSCPVQWLTGPAGSGKTVLLIEKVKEIASKLMERNIMERILVLCFNVPLSLYLENEINGWLREKYGSHAPCVTIKIKTYDSFIHEVGGFDATRETDELEKRRKDVEEWYTRRDQAPPDNQWYEHIFVDEGQDLPGSLWPKFLERLHTKPDSQRRYYFWVMFDSNQHVQLTATNDLPWDYLRNASNLTQVLRNTMNIFSLSKMYYEGISEGEIKLGHKEVGLDVHWDPTLKPDGSNTAELVANHIQTLRGKYVQPRDIVVLASTREDASSLIQGLASMIFDIRAVNAEQRLNSREDAVITVESIRRFKGLESKVVILCDPTFYPKDIQHGKVRQLLYTAVSRCFCFLIVVSTPEGCESIKNANIQGFSGSSIRSHSRKRAFSHLSTTWKEGT